MGVWIVHNNIKWAGHASFFIDSTKSIWIDPFRISDAVRYRSDIVLITHPHFDHYSDSDIKKVAKQECTVVAPATAKVNTKHRLVEVAPGDKITVEGICIEAVPAYNVAEAKLQFHPRSNNWVGYILTVDGARIYHAGDTDFIQEMKRFDRLDYALLPIGGTYVMELDEAIRAANAINAKHVVPMHYKALLGRDGSSKAEEAFRNNVRNALFLQEIQPAAYSF